MRWWIFASQARYAYYDHARMVHVKPYGSLKAQRLVVDTVSSVPESR